MGIESLLPLPNVSAPGKTELPLIEGLPKSTNDRGTNHFQPPKNQDTQTSLYIQAFHKQAQLELGQSTIVPSGTHTTFSDKNIGFSHLDIKLPKLISKGDILNPKTKKKPSEIPLPQLPQSPQSSVAFSKPSLRYVHYVKILIILF